MDCLPIQDLYIFIPLNGKNDSWLFKMSPKELLLYLISKISIKFDHLFDGILNYI